MLNLNLNDFEVLTFDCYGTLIDWESGILAALRPLVDAHGIDISDDELLELYGEVESAEEGVWSPYKEVLQHVLLQLAERLEIDLAEDQRNILVDSVANWPPFPDTVDSLKKLSENFSLGILSNIDNDLFAKSERLLDTEFKWVITAESAKAYKPSLRVFEDAQEEIGVDKQRWLHVAQSQFHDIAPANKFGLSTIHIDRRHAKAGFGATPPSDAKPSLTLPDLKSLSELIG